MKEQKTRSAYVTEYQQRVYSLCKQIPFGKITTYGILAKKLNSSPRAVGQALRCNPYAPRVPCHRVVSSNGHVGGFIGKTKGKEIQKKIRLLAAEGIPIDRSGIHDFAQHVHHF
ncbi:MGMT family protein [Candidatus Woesearchaeota archaeon]|nr:MGMT family protein [Candidatus Woesearchaeota archaeon]